MSIHVINHELEIKLARQRRNSTIASIIIGLLLVVLLAIIFWSIGLTLFTKNVQPIVTYSEDDSSEEVVEKVKINNAVKKTPAAPSSAVSPVITAATTSNFSIPTVEVTDAPLTTDFGSTDGFGDGWGEGFGNGFGGAGGGSFSFMGSNMSSDRVCFVIDYSISMKGKRIALLKRELKETISQLPDNIEYQLIFFSGPAWVAGSEVRANTKAGVVEFEGEGYKWKGNDMFNWYQQGKKQEVDWITSNLENRTTSLKAITETELVGGTDWAPPLEMAMTMSPKPAMIVFLTDGSSGDKTYDKAERIANKAKSRGIVVNTVALMEPDARRALSRIAKVTGGEFSLIGRDGKKEKQ